MMERFTGMDCLSLRDDGMTVEGRIVPYGEPTEITQRNPDTGEVERFVEEFLPGSLRAMVEVANKRGNLAFIPLNLDHNDISFDHHIGYTKALTETDDGAYATFRLLPNKDLEKVQGMLRESHTGLSIAFDDHRPPRISRGKVQRTAVRLGHVAATPSPAYAGAAISSIRGATEALEAPQTALKDVRAWLAAQRDRG